MTRALFACALLLFACDTPISSTSTGRRLPQEFRLSDSLTFAAVEPGSSDRFTGDLHYYVRWVEDDAPLADLHLVVHSTHHTPGFFFEFIGAQRASVPIGQRYLDESHFSDWSFRGTIDGQAYAARVSAESLHLDLMDGTVYVTLDVDLQPVGHSGPAYAGRIDGEGVQGSGTIFCMHPEAPRGRTDADMRAEYCDPIREAITETPDDPDAPPPPWDPDGDVIVCIEGDDDCGGSTPIAPPPPG